MQIHLVNIYAKKEGKHWREGEIFFKTLGNFDHIAHPSQRILKRQLKRIFAPVQVNSKTFEQ